MSGEIYIRGWNCEEYLQTELFPPGFSPYNETAQLVYVIINIKTVVTYTLSKEA